MKNILKIYIESFGHTGKGVGRINGKVVFADYALPKEEIVVRIIRERKNYIETEAVDILKPSAFRVKPVCPYYRLCGGCQLQHSAYEYQLTLKKDVFHNLFKRMIGYDIEDVDIVPSIDKFFYRKRAKFECFNDNWAFHKRNSDKMININRCYILDKQLNEYISKNRCRKGEIAVDDKNMVNGKNMLLDLSGVSSGLNIIYTKDVFRQVNRYINIKLINEIRSVLINNGASSILEFFSGIGNFTIPILECGMSVVAMEIDKDAILVLKNSAQRLRLDKKLKVKRVDLYKNITIKGNYSAVLLDPPRGGAAVLMKNILELLPELILYISCEPSTLLRDVKILLGRYDIKKVRLFDMFPQTYHFETLMVLSKR